MKLDDCILKIMSVYEKDLFRMKSEMKFLAYT